MASPKTPLRDKKTGGGRARTVSTVEREHQDILAREPPSTTFFMYASMAVLFPLGK